MSATHSRSGRVGGEVAVDEIRAPVGAAGRRSWSATACRGAWRPGCPCARISRSTRSAADLLAGALQRLPHAPVAVGVVVGRVHLADPLEQPLVLDRARRALAAGALVVGGRRHAQGPADRLDAEAAAMLVDEARSLRSVCVELGREKHRRRLQDLVRAAQLVDLPAQRLDLLALGRLSADPARWPSSASTRRTCLRNVSGWHAQITRDVRDRTTVRVSDARLGAHAVTPPALGYVSRLAEAIISRGGRASTTCIKGGICLRHSGSPTRKIGRFVADERLGARPAGARADFRLEAEPAAGIETASLSRWTQREPRRRPRARPPGYANRAAVPASAMSPRRGEGYGADDRVGTAWPRRARAVVCGAMGYRRAGGAGRGRSMIATGDAASRESCPMRRCGSRRAGWLRRRWRSRCRRHR